MFSFGNGGRGFAHLFSIRNRPEKKLCDQIASIKCTSPPKRKTHVSQANYNNVIDMKFMWLILLLMKYFWLIMALKRSRSDFMLF